MRGAIVVTFAVMASIVGYKFGWPYDMGVLLIGIITSELADLY